jgi:WD40-like Beta Propeller Repeat
MKPRDLVIVAAVLLVGGFAVADALREEGGTQAGRETAPTTTRPPPTTTREASGLGHATFPQVPGAGGTVAIMEADSCAVREFDLPTGIEFPNVVRRSTCDLWLAPVTAKVAVGVAERPGGVVAFRFIDLSHSARNLGGSEAAGGFLAWSPDGQRAAWCNRRRVGIDLTLGDGRRRLPGCPAGYTPANEVVLAVGDRLVVDGRTELRASGAISSVHYATDGSGSVAVEVDGKRIERYRAGRLTDTLGLPVRLQGMPATLSPDNCTALYRSGNTIQFVDLGCSRFRDGLRFAGTTAAWSPDGHWIAVAGETELTFYDLVGGQTVTWPVGAVQIGWRRE